MEKRTKIIIGVSVVLAASAIGAYFYLESKKSVDEKKPSDEAKPTDTKGATAQTVSDVKKPTKPIKASNTNTSNAAIPYGTKVYSTGNNVNIRNAPSMSAKVVGKVDNGQEIGLSAGKTSGTWVGVYHKNSQGTVWYVSKQYVKA